MDTLYGPGNSDASQPILRGVNSERTTTLADQQITVMNRKKTPVESGTQPLQINCQPTIEADSRDEKNQSREEPASATTAEATVADSRIVHGLSAPEQPEF